MVSARHDHVVRFYDRDDELVAELAGFVVEALACAEPLVCIATREHREALEALLTARGTDLDEAVSSGAYTALDAAEALAGFMVAGRPDPDRFERVVGGLLDDVNRSGAPVRAYGEMVALLWAEGNEAAAIELEQLWNDLADSRDFSLLCAYPTTALLTAPLQDTNRVCALHSEVRAPDSYIAGGPDELVIDDSVVLVAVPEAVAAARRFVERSLPLDADVELREDAELVVSELATNAVRHASSAFRLSVRQDGPGLRVAVEDADVRSPREQKPGPDERGGRGVGIVGKLSTRWGYEVREAGKVVWAELDEVRLRSVPRLRESRRST